MHVKGLCFVAVVSLVSGGALLGGDAKETGEKDLKKIQGTWRFVSQEWQGQARPAQDVAKLTITFTGDKWEVRDDGKLVQGGTNKLDPTKKPAQVDAAVTEGEGKGTTMLGIYEVNGDTMKVCFDPQGKERPTNFASKEGQFSAVTKREKQK